jgi:hypothetical protein
MKPVFIAEIGFTESYIDLLRSMKFWLSAHDTAASLMNDSVVYRKAVANYH